MGPSEEIQKRGDCCVYQFEAEMIAQRVRSNSSAAGIEKTIRETMDEIALDNDEVRQMVLYIQAAVKR